MNIFMPNDVYSLASQRIRILWSYGNVIIWIDIDDRNALPKSSSKNEFEHLMASNELSSIDDPYLKISLLSTESGSRASEVQNRAWEAIKDSVLNEPKIYQRKDRGKMISDIMDKTGSTKQTVYRWFRRYWQFGKCENALNGRYDLCGGAGKTKRRSSKKIGAPRTRTPGTGINVNDEVKKIFRRAIDTCLLNENQYDFSYAYNQVLIMYGVSLPCKPEDLRNVPTERQFRYFYENEYSSIEVTKKRNGMVNYLKDFRPVLGTSTSEVSGPGSRYQIDATIADIYLVSERDREKGIGRPTMYFVVDVFSRAIVGMYIGLENPSWVSAREAISNAVLDKVSYCAQYGIEITEDQWPTIGLPESILGDRGELLSQRGEILSKSFGITIENTSPYRADWKGIVERRFRTIQAKMKPYVEGYVTKAAIGKKRNGEDYRKKSKQTLYDFIRAIIKIVLHYNNDHYISTYDPDPDIPPELPLIPIDLWNWGIVNRTGRLRRPDPNIVKINLLPHTNALITEHGLKLFGCFYSCTEAVDMGWFEGNYSGPRKIQVAYDLYSANTIYIRPSDSYLEYIEATLTARSRAYENLTIWEVWQINDIRASVAATSRIKERSSLINLDYDLKEIGNESRNAQPKKSTISKAEKIRGISANKRSERQYERKKKANNGSEVIEDDYSNKVISIRDYKEEEKSFKRPSRLKDLLKKD